MELIGGNEKYKPKNPLVMSLDEYATNIEPHNKSLASIALRGNLGDKKFHGSNNALGASGSIQQIEDSLMVPSMDAKQFTSYMEDQDSPDSKRYATEGLNQMATNPSNKRTYMPPSLISYDRISFQRLNNEKQYFGPY